MGLFLSMHRTKLISVGFSSIKDVPAFSSLFPPTHSFYREPLRTEVGCPPGSQANYPISRYAVTRCLPTKTTTIVMMQLRKLSFFNDLCRKPLHSNFVTSLYFCDLNLKIQNYVTNKYRISLICRKKQSFFHHKIIIYSHISFHFVLISNTKDQIPAFACFFDFSFKGFYEF